MDDPAFSPPAINPKERNVETGPFDERQYHLLFDSIDEGFAILELERDAQGRLRDLVYRGTNPAFERHTGWKNIAGKRASQLLPRLDQTVLDTIQRVAETGQPSRSETYAPGLDRWYDVVHLRLGGPGSPYVAAVFRDITAARRLQQQQAFLNELSRDLVGFRGLAHAAELLAEKIGRQFQAKWCKFGERDPHEESYILSGWHADDVVSIKGEHRIRDYLSEDQVQRDNAGELTIVGDTQADPRVRTAGYSAPGIRSFLVVPLARDGLCTFRLAIMDDRPRQWRTDEIDLAREITDRIWTRAERARAEEALRRSEAKYRTLFETFDEAYCLVEIIRDPGGRPVDLRYLEVNQVFERQTGLRDAAGRTQTDLGLATEPLWYEKYDQVARTGLSTRFESFHRPTGRWYNVFFSRPSAEQADRVAVVFYDVTGRKRQEQHQAFLLKLSDAMRPLSDAVQIQRAAMQVTGEFLQVDRAFYSEIRDDGQTLHIEDNYVRPGVPKVTGDFPVRSFGEAMEVLRRGEMLVIEDETATALKTPLQREASTALGVFASATVPLIKDGRWVANFGVLQGSPRVWAQDELAILQETAERTWAAVVRARAEQALRLNQQALETLNDSLEQKVQEKTAQMRTLASQLTRAEQRERDRISHILHDDLQQRIYSIQVQLSFLREELPEEDAAAQGELAGIDTQLRELLTLTRHLSIDLNPPILPGEGLLHAVQWLAGQALERYGLPVELQAEDPLVLRDQELHVLLFNCVRELLSNVVRHAGAAHATVRLQKPPGELRIQVCDDGRGFSPMPASQGEVPAAPPQDDLPESFGLTTIRHKLSLYGGSMQITSAPGQGTQVLLVVPLAGEGTRPSPS